MVKQLLLAMIGWIGGFFILVMSDTHGVEPDAGEAANRIRSDLNFLASDQLAGRGVGTEGIEQAGEFIAERFRALGFQTDGFEGKPFQDFEITGPTVLGPPAENELAFRTGDAAWQSLELNRDFNPLSLGKSGRFSGRVAFAGYGITASEYAYDDYGSFDAQGKVVLVLRKEPQQNQADSRFDGTQNSQYAFFTSKEVNAALHRAAALVLINDAATAAAATQRAKQDLERAEQQVVELDKAPLPEEAKAREELESRRRVAQQQVEQLRAKIESGAVDPLVGLNEAGSAISDQQVPTYYCTRALANQLLKAGGDKTLEQLEAAIDETGAPQSFVLQGVEVRGQVNIVASKTPVRNVIGVLPGAGQLAGEYVVVGAHYDHVGMGGMGSLAPGTVAVHNGADDNGSGTVTMLEVARACAQSKSPNRRSLIFMAFTAEESGLLGSLHYVRNPRWPLEKTVAMVNLDMVGRLLNDELTVYGTGTAEEFASQIDRLNQPYQFKLVKVPQGRGASDHASFYDAKIPVYHFFTGLHNDYHRPSDDVDKLNVDGMVRISRLVADVVCELADAADRPRLREVKGSASPRSQTGGRAVLGVRLERDPNGEPRLLDVTAGGPAANAGLQAGDRVLAINGEEIRTVMQLRQVLAQAKAGTKLSVKVQRDSVTETVDVQLAP